MGARGAGGFLEAEVEEPVADVGGAEGEDVGAAVAEVEAGEGLAVLGAEDGDVAGDVPEALVLGGGPMVESGRKA
ncbi:MAG: hypothetical protein KIT09_15700 [Bryobacteraceae bacterium]|nr:hypothetical protein [Bryobacteraceae bacterium]